MAQRKPEDKVTVEQVLKLVDRLSASEQSELLNKLEAKAWRKEWNTLLKLVDAQNAHQPTLSEEEIMTAVKQVREELKAERAQDSSH